MKLDDARGRRGREAGKISVSGLARANALISLITHHTTSSSMPSPSMSKVSKHMSKVTVRWPDSSGLDEGGLGTVPAIESFSSSFSWAVESGLVTASASRSSLVSRS